MDVARRQRRENGVELAISDERLAANDGHVKRIPRVDEADESLDELVAAVIREAAQGDVAAEVRVTERITAWAPQRAFPRDLDRQVGLPSSQDAAPRLHDRVVALSRRDRWRGPTALAWWAFGGQMGSPRVTTPVWRANAGWTVASARGVGVGRGRGQPARSTSAPSCDEPQCRGEVRPGLAIPVEVRHPLPDPGVRLGDAGPGAGAAPPSAPSSGAAGPAPGPRRAARSRRSARRPRGRPARAAPRSSPSRRGPPGSAHVGIESTDAGCARTLCSEARAAAVYW